MKPSLSVVLVVIACIGTVVVASSSLCAAEEDDLNTSTTVVPTTTAEAPNATNTTTTTAGPFKGKLVKSPTEGFVISVFSSIAVGLVVGLVFHFVIQPRYLFINPYDSFGVANRDSYVRGGGGTTSSNVQTGNLPGCDNPNVPPMQQNYGTPIFKKKEGAGTTGF